jgi:uncharacterized low-complexity protein
MSKETKTLKPLSIAIGAAFVASMAASNIASAAPAAGDNPFAMNELDSGYMQVASEGKCGEGKCGEGKKDKKKEGKCGEGKCGEGKKDKKEGKCGEGKKKEGKCGEGKCGGSN